MEGWDITGEVFAAFFGAVNEGMVIFGSKRATSVVVCVLCFRYDAYAWSSHDDGENYRRERPCSITRYTI